MIRPYGHGQIRYVPFVSSVIRNHAANDLHPTISVVCLNQHVNQDTGEQHG
jgi:hypothetical protein